MGKKLYLIAGANGSGKSTLAHEILKNEKIVFLNADEIAGELSPNDLQKVRITAGKQVYEKLFVLMNAGKDIAIETTLSGKNHLKIIEKAHKAGYNVAIIYAFLDSPQMCIARIRGRVLKGGHFIPDEDVFRRYYRSLHNFLYFYKDVADSWFLFYNGGEHYTSVAHFEQNCLDILDINLYNIFMGLVENDK